MVECTSIAPISKALFIDAIKHYQKNPPIHCLNRGIFIVGHFSLFTQKLSDNVIGFQLFHLHFFVAAVEAPKLYFGFFIISVL